MTRPYSAAEENGALSALQWGKHKIYIDKKGELQDLYVWEWSVKYGVKIIYENRDENPLCP